MPVSACLTTWSGLSAAKLHHQESLIGQDSVGQRHLRNRTVMTPTTDQVWPLHVLQRTSTPLWYMSTEWKLCVQAAAVAANREAKSLHKNAQA